MRFGSGRRSEATIKASACDCQCCVRLANAAGEGGGDNGEQLMEPSQWRAVAGSERE